MQRFIDVVSEQTVLDAGFNYHQMSFGIQKENSLRYAVYLGEFGPVLKIVVIESEHPGEKEWYFASYQGERPGECSTREEAEVVRRKIEGFICEQNRVLGRDLEGLIKGAVDKCLKGL